MQPCSTFRMKKLHTLQALKAKTDAQIYKILQARQVSITSNKSNN